MTREVANQPSEELTLPRPWPVRLMNLLLVLEAAGLLSIALFHDQPLGLSDAPDLVEIIQAVVDRLSYTTIFGGLAVLAVVAVIGFWRLWPIGWSLAMLLQGLNLIVGLILYFTSRPFYTYTLMLFTILLVIYLHHSDIQTTFQTKAASMSQVER